MKQFHTGDPQILLGVDAKKNVVPRVKRCSEFVHPWCKLFFNRVMIATDLKRSFGYE